MFMSWTHLWLCVCVWYSCRTLPSTTSSVHLCSFGNGLERGQQCKQARSVVICLCVWGGRKVVGLGEKVFLASHPLIDGVNWVGQGSVKGGVCGWRLPFNCRLPDSSRPVGGQRGQTIDKTHTEIRPQNKYPLRKSVHKHLNISLFTSQDSSMCVSLYVGVYQIAEASLPSLRGRALRLFCVSVSGWLYHSDLAPFFLSSAQNVFLFSLLYSLPWEWFLKKLEQM